MFNASASKVTTGNSVFVEPYGGKGSSPHNESFSTGAL